MDLKNKKIIIIGGGIGGLATACYLSKAGFDVKLFEKNKNLGGRANKIEEKGYFFDTGPTWFLMKDIFENFYSLMGKNLYNELNILKLEPNFKVFFERGDEITIYSDFEKNADIFENLEKGSYEKLIKYINIQEKLYEFIKKNFLFNEINLLNIFNLKLLKYFRELNPFKNNFSYISKIFKNEKILKLLQFSLVFLGNSPYRTPALYNILNYFVYKQGIFYPLGGMYKIVESLERIAKENGVEIYKEIAVKEFYIKDGIIKYIILDNEEKIDGDIFVSNADLYFTENFLIKDKKYRTYDDNFFRKLEIAPSAFLMYIGIKSKIDHLCHHNFYFSYDWNKNFSQIFNYDNFPDDPSFYFASSSLVDDSVAPPGCTSLYVLVPISANFYPKEKQIYDFKNKILSKIYELIDYDFSRDIEVENIFGPQNFYENYNAYQGTALGITHNLKQTIFRPKIKSKKIKNLYYVGAYTYPGIGIPMVFISAQILFKKIKGIKSKKPLDNI